MAVHDIQAGSPEDRKVSATQVGFKRFLHRSRIMLIEKIVLFRKSVELLGQAERR
jgi:hypothetical protein